MPVFIILRVIIIRIAININGDDVIFNNACKFIIRYKTQFNADYVDDIEYLRSLEEGTEEYESKAFEIGYRLIWSMAETDYPPEVFYDIYDNINIYSVEFVMKHYEQVYSEIIRILNASIYTDDEIVENTNDDAVLLKMKNLISNIKMLGFSYREICEYPLNDAIDVMNTYAEMIFGKNTKAERKATQEDFDNFFK